MIYDFKEIFIKVNQECKSSISNNDLKFLLIHSMTYSIRGKYMNSKGQTLPAFTNEQAIIDFMTDSLKVANVKVSAHILILQDGTRIIFGTKKDVMYHAGRGRFERYHSGLNKKSLGIELARNYDNDQHEQYTDNQYRSLAEYCSQYSDLGFSDITYHYITAPDRKTDPENFDVSRFESCYYDSFPDPNESFQC